MITFPNAKINLGLFVTDKRPDGFHNLESIFTPISWCDILEVIPSSELTFKSSGINIPSSLSQNLVIQAYNLLKDNYDLPPVSVLLDKRIPIGAGLGGGSADASFMLLLLNQYFNLNINQDELCLYANKIGSDCPFFIKNQPCLVKGTGELLKPINIDLKDYKIALINPGIHISTKEAYSGITPKKPKSSILDIIQSPIDDWESNGLKNDFEDHIFQNHPVLPSIKKQLYNAGASYSAMSGSGSTIFGIFKNEIPELNLDDNWQFFNAKFT